MYKSIEKLRELRKDKLKILNSVYEILDFEKVHQKQPLLGAMSVSIMTEVGNTILSVLQEDGVSNLVWTNVSLRLKKLSFISVPPASEIKSQYDSCIKQPVRGNFSEAPIKVGAKAIIRSLNMPQFMALMVAQGLAVPILVSGTWTMVKILSNTVNAALIVVEVVSYCKATQQRKNKSPVSRLSNPAPEVDFSDMYKNAIRKVWDDNRKTLNLWFDKLEEILAEEIEKEKGEKANEYSV